MSKLPRRCDGSAHRLPTHSHCVHDQQLLHRRDGRGRLLLGSHHLNALLPRSLWKPQTCGVAKILPNADAYLEPWTMLGHLSARNRVRRLHLGVGLTDTGRRNPAITAQAAATLHLLSRGRAILGIGTGEREANEPYGVDWTRPVARFEEAMATIRALWNSKGELVNPGL